MKKLIPIIVLLFAISGFAQEKPNSVLVDEFGRPCNEELLYRFDDLIGQQNNYPGTSAYIYFYGDDELEGRNLSFASYLKRGYFRLKDDPDRQFRFVQGGTLSEMKIQLWLVPRDAPLPSISPKLSGSPAISKPTLFNKGWADFNQWYGSLHIYEMGFYDLGCNFPPNVKEFAKKIKDNPRLRGHLIVYTQPGHGQKRGNAVAKFAINDMKKRFGVPGNRLSSAYGGKRTEPEIELWLVPAGAHSPKPTSAFKKK